VIDVTSSDDCATPSNDSDVTSPIAAFAVGDEYASAAPTAPILIFVLY
jgi:hypothetical protein